ncbi:MAG: sorbosone dehydrogenase family protein [Candidatus Hydrogenedentes bacterium]|nr:sorbosone dehydrogenase family protein [Candidatus Hydrogenedentota bacterium]
MLIPSCTGAAGSMDGMHLDMIKLPPGFTISMYAEDVPNARSMVLSPGGILFVGSREDGNGQVYAIVDENKDNKADEVVVIASGLTQPNGVAFRDGSLYVAEISRIIRFDNIETTFRNSPSYTVVDDTFPADTHHGWKFIAFGPDDKLYVPVGAPCNICLRDDNPIYASITRMDPDGSNREIYAEGIRNTVGFAWHPDTNELWFTDNGRDWLGDNVPPDELNHAPQSGMHFGFPHWHGLDTPDPQYGSGHTASDFTLPVQELGPHVAALGMRFYTGSMFPAEYQKQIFIAEHGSWNRSTPIGYRVMLVRLNGGQATSYEVFAEGWLQDNGNAWGRPVDVQVMPDGSMLVSDDRANAIYRITYGG